MTRTIFIAGALALAAVLPAIPAQAALLTRTFVSSAGKDSNPCTITLPCASFAVAYAATAANGIIAALDPGKYGPIIITGPVTINGYGWAAITGAANNDAITINAVSGNVALIGLEIDGAGAAHNGIQINSVSNLTIRDSEIQNFMQYGIDFAPNVTNPTKFFVSNTLISDASNGINIAPTNTGAVVVAIDHVKIQNTTNVALNVFSSTQQVGLTVSDSAIVGNSNIGISATEKTYAVIWRSNISGNGTGLEAGSAAVVRISQSIITDNGQGWFVTDGVSQINSTGDNLIDGNLAENTQPPSTPYK
jgi:hypothetical protein